MADLNRIIDRIIGIIDQARVTEDVISARIQPAYVFGPYDPRFGMAIGRNLTAAQVSAAVDKAQEGLRALPTLVASWGDGPQAITAADFDAADARVSRAVEVCPVLVSAYPGFYLPLPNDEYVCATWLDGGIEYEEACQLMTSLRHLVVSRSRHFFAGDAFAELVELLDLLEQPLP